MARLPERQGYSARLLGLEEAHYAAEGSGIPQSKGYGAATGGLAAAAGWSFGCSRGLDWLRGHTSEDQSCTHHGTARHLDHTRRY